MAAAGATVDSHRGGRAVGRVASVRDPPDTAVSGDADQVSASVSEAEASPTVAPRYTRRDWVDRDMDWDCNKA